jgi:hydantoinase/carbamoylase family amidase
VDPAGVTVSGARLRERLEALAKIGADPRGGVSRFSFTPAHTDAARLVGGWMREAGLAPTIDGAGNLIGGTAPPSADGAGPAIAAGSHLDTVPMGGIFDGALGVLAAVECAQAMRDAGASWSRPFVAIGFADEEGNQFGVGCLTSRFFVGELSGDHMRTIQDADGRTLGERIAAWEAPWPRGGARSLAAYLELHIEQGPKLEADGLDGAVATAIAGMSRATITYRGHANHAGTTPMTMRKDALWGASAFVLAMRRLALYTGGEAVATVGRLDVEPGATNVIPGVGRLRVELRSGREELLEQLRGATEIQARGIGLEYELDVEVSEWSHSPVVPLDESLQSMALAHGARRGARVIRMPSWAGHDAKVLAPRVPTVLLFVPSRGGVSHHPHEWTDWKHATLGAQWLLDTVTALDRNLPPE